MSSILRFDISLVSFPQNHLVCAPPVETGKSESSQSRSSEEKRALLTEEFHEEFMGGCLCSLSTPGLQISRSDHSLTHLACICENRIYDDGS